ncbi:hypothetical protein TNCV_2550371 [Trichonephila clavipes]|nr:hypothetical protein TNCV_2550371 [Trichonephila clavipes]
MRTGSINHRYTENHEKASRNVKISLCTSPASSVTLSSHGHLTDSPRIHRCLDAIVLETKIPGHLDLPVSDEQLSTIILSFHFLELYNRMDAIFASVYEQMKKFVLESCQTVQCSSASESKKAQ